ncbi:type IX secretion system membrane protein PorP/SprF [Tenacibaculum tangerinum]|uniref:Type IX secretion system membrane protein PorP/SprF n=1 Tax=Tenacibaculum tangerinum TaxID=3038772 RepID=A0ABY8L553_9FLAO|nr:type IX secretion system membrane protein PorP/SprF [Tenacibaculum tangerinum]WGH75483.1 type IX secretion system membrane protein PorP/SprF [Tenacibaculum tangerinum]
MNKITKYMHIVVCPILLFLFLGTNHVEAQQDSQYTQYMYATNIINPAYVGSRDMWSITSQYRAQWTGLEGAPKTINLTVNGPLSSRYDNMGIGLDIIHETIGPSVESNLVADYSYKVKLNQYISLAFGVKAGLKLINIDYTKLDIYDTTDPSFQYNINNRLGAVIGAGLYLYDDLWYAGVSVPDFLTTDYYDDTTVSTARERMTYYAMGGYVFYINDDLKFKPAFLAKMTSGAPIVADISANFLFNEKFTLGASYRFGLAVSAITGFQVNDNFLIGYSYDLDTTNLGNYNGGSHGIFLRYDFESKRSVRLLTPRFF